MLGWGGAGPVSTRRGPRLDSAGDAEALDEGATTLHDESQPVRSVGAQAADHGVAVEVRTVPSAREGHGARRARRR